MVTTGGLAELPLEGGEVEVLEGDEVGGSQSRRAGGHHCLPGLGKLCRDDEGVQQTLHLHGVEVVGGGSKALTGFWGQMSRGVLVGAGLVCGQAATVDLASVFIQIIVDGGLVGVGGVPALTRCDDEVEDAGRLELDVNFGEGGQQMGDAGGEGGVGVVVGQVVHCPKTGFSEIHGDEDGVVTSHGGVPPVSLGVLGVTSAQNVAGLGSGDGAPKEGALAVDCSEVLPDRLDVLEARECIAARILGDGAGIFIHHTTHHRTSLQREGGTKGNTRK